MYILWLTNFTSAGCMQHFICCCNDMSRCVAAASTVRLLVNIMSTKSNYHYGWLKFSSLGAFKRSTARSAGSLVAHRLGGLLGRRALYERLLTAPLAVLLLLLLLCFAFAARLCHTGFVSHTHSLFAQRQSKFSTLKFDTLSQRLSKAK